MDPYPVDAWQCSMCGELYLADYDAAYECCEEAELESDAGSEPYAPLRLVG